MRVIPGGITLDDVTSLVTACTSALSSPAVALELVTTLDFICGGGMGKNRVPCGAGGAIEAIVAAMSAHGAARADVAAVGCGALAWMALGNTTNADCMVLSSGALNEVYRMMETHAWVYNVQKEACETLYIIAGAAPRDALDSIREGRAVELLAAAKVNHPEEELLDRLQTVVRYADRALSRLV